MNKQTSQLRSLFLRNILSFAVIFVLLGIIVNWLLMSSLYRNIDNTLIEMSHNQEMINREINMSLNPQGNLGRPIPPNIEKEMPFNNFQTQIVVWDVLGQIVNQNTLGSRSNDFSNLTLDSQPVDEIKTVTVADSFNQKLRFRSILVETGFVEAPFIQILYNTNPLEESFSFFQRVLIICMVVFWLISILVSYYLAKWNIQPIVLSWRKQQEFVENSSHELRTPLTIIQTKLEKLFTKPNQTIIDSSEDIALALNEVKRLEQLTNALLLLAKSDSDVLVINKEKFSNNELLNETVLPFKEIAELDKKELTLSLGENSEVFVDKNLFKQLVVILLDNALKYTKTYDKITVTSRVINEGWQIEVRDTGIGVQTQNTDDLFERFYREDKARQRSTGGHGLGLSIAKWVTELHGGKISVHKNEPQGTVFLITLPIIASS